MMNANKQAYYKKIYHKGNHIKSYKFLGSHITTCNGKKGVRFRLWAPNAKEVRLVGDFNYWNGEDHVMENENHTGYFTLFVSGMEEGNNYKYEIVTANDVTTLKTDPYAFYSELRPKTASIVSNIKDYKWNDHRWFEDNRKTNISQSPMNIYEVHLGSWKRKEDNSFYTYREIADMLAIYVKEMGYTHIELLPILEHPYDGSWGYQITGYFSVTSRYGTINDFKYFVDKFHEQGIGVILDWVPGHFCKDEHGLHRFDGTPLYEYSNDRLGENYDWGTANFDLGKPEVQSFLISNAVFWFDIYHIDGLRVDAVANMLYLNYGSRETMGIRNKYGGNENIQAVEFIKKLNKVIVENFENPLIIAEESTTWPQVTKPTYIGGLGFNYKWNMGWMNDMLRYNQIDPIHKKWHHELITFSLMYAFSENFILPLSHDEVVHGKKSLIDRMPGTYENKFANLKAFYGYMMTHPGKKLLFMGGEFAQFAEWNHDKELDWNLLSYPLHKKMKSYVKDLNHFYKDESCLWELDYTSDGFSWIDHQNFNQSIISFVRKGKEKNNFIIIVCNFTPESYENYKVGVPRFANYEEVFNSDSKEYEGTNTVNTGSIPPIREKWNNEKYCINISVPPLSTIFIKPKFKEKGLNYYA